MRPSARPLPWSVIAGLALAVILDTFVQIAWKQSMAAVPTDHGLVAGMLAAAHSPLFYLAMLGFAAQLFNWTRVLAKADLSFAQPITALSYISVLAISRLALHEAMSSTKLTGVILILAGVAFISQSSASTEASAPGKGASA